MELSEFLLARIAEDEAANRIGPEPEEWCDRAEGLHFDHSRVLAECDAKRRVLAMRKTYNGRPFEGEPDVAVSAIAVGAAVLDAVLRALALPYADHPDYRQEWKSPSA